MHMHCRINMEIEAFCRRAAPQLTNGSAAANTGSMRSARVSASVSSCGFMARSMSCQFPREGFLQEGLAEGVNGLDFGAVVFHNDLAGFPTSVQVGRKATLYFNWCIR
jgi:hypothetical protein